MALVSASTAAKMGEDEAMTMSNPPSSSLLLLRLESNISVIM